MCPVRWGARARAFQLPDVDEAPAVRIQAEWPPRNRSAAPWRRQDLEQMRTWPRTDWYEPLSPSLRSPRSGAPAARQRLESVRQGRPPPERRAPLARRSLEMESGRRRRARSFGRCGRPYLTKTGPRGHPDRHGTEGSRGAGRDIEAFGPQYQPPAPPPCGPIAAGRTSRRPRRPEAANRRKRACAGPTARLAGRPAAPPTRVFSRL